MANNSEQGRRDRTSMESPSDHRRQRDLAELHIAALKGDWNAAKKLLAKNFTLIRAHVTTGQENILHIAAAEGKYSFVKKLLAVVERDQLGNRAAAEGKYSFVNKLLAMVKRIHLGNQNTNRSPALGTALENQSTNGSPALRTDLENQSTNGSPALRTDHEIQNTNGSPARRTDLENQSTNGSPALRTDHEIQNTTGSPTHIDHEIQNTNGSPALRTDLEIRNTNGSPAIRTDIENQSTNGSPALRTDLEIQRTNGSSALRTDHEIQRTNGSPALRNDHEIQHTNGAVALRDYLKFQNTKGSTALCYAAATGHIKIVKLMVRKCPDLPKIRRQPIVNALYFAVLQGHKEMANYLFDKSDIASEGELINLLTTSIHSGLYDLAAKIVKECRVPLLTKDVNDETPLQVLARKPLAFSGTGRQGSLGKIASTIFSYIKLRARDSTTPSNAYTVLRDILCRIERQQDVETAQLSCMPDLLFDAAESGNDGFLVELLRWSPGLMFRANDGHSIFHIAVLHRRITVFNLIYELHGVKDLILSYIDGDGNNILHLAAKLAPQCQLNKLPGAAFQVQREVLWYKEVEKVVPPSYRNKKNQIGETPKELFLKQHRNLMIEGEKQMKQIATSCMLVTILIATVTFATAFTVPGDYKDDGAPALKDKKLFLVFTVTTAIATLGSLASTLMFLAVFISRYSDKDFVESVPFRLVMGVVSLFISIIAMMGAFCSCILLFQQRLAIKIGLFVLSGGVIFIFVKWKGRLLIDIVCSTCSSRWLFRSKNRLLS